MSARELNREEAVERNREMRSYLWGFGLALVLTLIPFGLATFAHLHRITLYWIIGGCALVQIVVHFRCFLHISLARNKREDLDLILFSILILTLMAGGTIWILFDLYYRMVPSMLA